MNANSQRALIWTGVGLMLLYLIGYVFLMGFLPPPSPLLDASQVLQLYVKSNVAFRAGVMLCIFSAGFFLPWAVAISVQMARHEKGTPVWSIVQVLAGSFGTVLFFLPPIFWGVAAFSTQRDPALTLLMHELGFLTFVPFISFFPMQTVSIAIVAFSSKLDEESSAFPHWFGWLTLWSALVADAGVAAMLFKTGPFAWNGLLSFYLPLFVFVLWISVLIVLMLRAIAAQERAVFG